jgi:enoyl-CoA hydratase/carnithine racemase
MSYEAITYEVKDEVAVVTLNRPEARNALDIRMREEIADATLRIRDDESLKAMVLTGRRRSAVESGSRISIFGCLTSSI